MKLVSKRMSINQDTFAPEMEVVLRLPVEPGQDSSTPEVIRIAEKFVELLTSEYPVDQHVARPTSQSLEDRIKSQLEFVEQEISRVKGLVNSSGFNCTTAVYVHVKQYRDRDALKKHAELLRMNLDE